MKKPVNCKSCGASDIIETDSSEIRCSYCNSLIFYTDKSKLNILLSGSKKQATGNNTWSYIITGYFIIFCFSLFAAYLDAPRWFRSDLAIAIWSCIIPLFTLIWVIYIHPNKRSLPVFLLFIFVNVFPFMISALNNEGNRLLNSDDFWGISGMFAGASAAGFLIGALINNFRK